MCVPHIISCVWKCQFTVIFKHNPGSIALKTQFDGFEFLRLSFLFEVGNQVLAVYLMAAKLGVPVCPHAGGVGLCNMVPHLQVNNLIHITVNIIRFKCDRFQTFDFVCLSGSVENRLVEWVDHLHHHFKCPPTVQNGRSQSNISWNNDN